MDKVILNHLNLNSADGTQLNMEALYRIAPSVFTEARDPKTGKVSRKVNFEALRQLLGDNMMDGDGESYQFTWVGKNAAKAEAARPTDKTLRPVPEDSVDWDNTQNLYIEGDNLEVLKLLQRSYLGKVKMIYIDPPYNTGNDFVYDDDFARTATDEDLEAGNVDELGYRYRKNTDSNGKFHSDWCSMIYPRLLVARSLLKEDGVIFISIDDNEVRNLKNICDEVFGEGNFVAIFPWRKRTAKSDVPFGVSQDYEWILAYAKSGMFIASIDGKERKYYTTNDFPNKPWRVHDMSTQRTALERPNSNFTMINPKNGKEYPVNPQAVWRVTKEGFPQYLKESRIVFPGDYDFLNISKPVLRYWKEEDIKKAGDAFGRIAVTTKLEDNIGMSQDGTKEIISLFEGKVFSYPKPSSLIKFYLKIINDSNALVLDFFSGSASTAHAVMQLNAKDQGNRKFIMVQLPEETPEDGEARKAGYKTIPEIGKERVRRAGKKIKEESPLKTQNLDTGFRVFRLDESNYEEVSKSPKDYEQDMLSLFANNIKADRTDLDLLFGAMLAWGVTLDLPMTSETVDGCTIYTVNNGDLVACFSEGITDNVVKAMAAKTPLRVLFRDSCFAQDAQKINIYEQFKQLMDWADDEAFKNIKVI